MDNRFISRLVVSTFAIVLSLSSFELFAQGRNQPPVAPPHRPRVKMIGFLNAEIAKTETRPVVTFTLPKDEKQYTFLLADMKILAGPLRTPGSILSEVKPYSPNFRVRTSQELAEQIKNTMPTEQLTLSAEYYSADRVLFVEGVEKSEPEQGKNEQPPKQ